MQDAREIPAEVSDLRYRPKRGVYLIDRVAEGVVTLGGMAVIVAVLGIIAYLLWVVLPLMQSGHVEGAGTTPAPSSSVRVLALDEYQRVGTALSQDGALQSFSLESGEAIGETQQLGAFAVHSFASDSGVLALGHDDGTITIATIEYDTDIDSRQSVDEAARALEIGDRLILDDAIVEHVSENQFRTITPEVTLGDQIAASDSESSPIAIDADQFGRDSAVAVLREDGTGSVLVVSTKRSLVGGNSKTSVKSYPIELEEGTSPATDITMLDSGREVVLFRDSGEAERYSREGGGYVFAERVQPVDEGERITTVQPLLGRGTILIGTDTGRIDSLMLTRADDSGERNLVRVRSFLLGDSPVESIAISQRDRTFAATDMSGRVRLWHATSGKLVGSADAESGAVRTLAVAPKMDGFHAVTDAGIESWHLEAGHPGATFQSLFLPTWYEGDPAPSLVYQSTAADDSAESKMSLTPLIFGTLKATVFAMLFAVPIAVMAAIYSSEFMSPRLRQKIKPTIEMMASLPSVVLGFIAAMVLAPFVRDYLSAVLVGLLLVPVFILLCASAWPLLGRHAWRISQSTQLGVIVLAGLAGVLLSAWAGPAIDRALFSLRDTEERVLAGFVEPVEEVPQWAAEHDAFTLTDRARLRRDNLYVVNDEIVRAVGLEDPAIRAQFEARRETIYAGESPFKLWLTGIVGSPLSGWVALMFTPALIVTWFIGASVSRRHTANWMPLVRSALSIAATLPLAYLIAMLLASFGLDPRESILGTFSQRNTFVVGVIMGFAVIPIIFTISDDALQSVPRSLRAASLGAGATPWQTAVRIVLPVAASGIFSAVMIGLGRAAGETMIVLMATGNTPVMDWNIFGGLRTLSANIAVELPEAERGGTHYRVLFLCGVVLFVITFVVNTTAEVIRQHFRKRSAML